LEEFLNNKGVIAILSKWKLHIFVITILGTLISFGVTFLISPEYSSNAIVYPVNLGTYSDESHTEQMLQILDSRDIKDKVISSFDLINHYSIDTSKADYMSAVYSKYDKNIDINKTEFESVNIKVSDKNSEIAAQIVDSIIDYYNQKVTSLYRIKILEVIDIAKKELKRWTEIRDSLNNELLVLRDSLGIQDYDIQLETVTTGLYRTNDKKLISEAKEFLKILAKYGPKQKILKERFEQADKEVADAIIAYNKSIKEYNKEITYTQVITNPYESYKKNNTKKMIMTILGMLSSFVFSIFLVILLEKRKS
jgi:uncharacterized protein involved in exopolysaccharide biosynthesis